MVHIREIYSLICNACSHGKTWLSVVSGKTQLTFLAHFVILKLHIWESSLTVRLSNPHMRKQENMVENTDQNNAVNEDLKDIQEMVDVVKRDGEVSLQYMKSFEHDQLMYEEGRMAEIKNTEREMKRADMAQSRIKELEAELKKYREKPTA